MRNSLRKIITAVTTAGAVALAVTAVTVAPAPAAHAVGCFQNGCLGKDPQAMGCSSDAQTIASNGQIMVRYSAACGAYWARHVYFSTDSSPEAILYGWTCNPGCVSHTEDSGFWNQFPVWSPMIPTGYWVQACAPGGSYGDLYCTDVTGDGHGPR
jgi:hypothetical protein